MDIQPPYTYSNLVSLWELGNLFSTSANEIYGTHAAINAAGKELSSNRDYYFLGANGPTSLVEGYEASMVALAKRALRSVQQVNTILVVLLILEGCVICSVACFVMWRLLLRISAHRYRVFGIFVGVPTGFVRALAARQVVIDEDDDIESDSDLDDPTPPPPPPPPATSGGKFGLAPQARASNMPPGFIVEVPLVATDGAGGKQTSRWVMILKGNHDVVPWQLFTWCYIH